VLLEAVRGLARPMSMVHMAERDFDKDYDYIPAETKGEWRLPAGLKRSLPFYFRRKWVSFGEPIPLFEHLHKTFGKIAHYRFMGTVIVFVNDPEWINEILVNQSQSFVKERTLKRMKILLGEGLITSDDPIHMRQRRIAAPAFHRQRIAGSAGQIVASAAATREGWREGVEFDLAEARWTIPAERMKMDTPHIVPLSRQAVEVLRALKLLTGNGRFVLPGANDNKKPISNNTILYALYRLGYRDRMTGHGFRGLASTILHEKGFDEAHIELQLAHMKRDKVAAAYNHAKYLKQRAEMMQWWAGYLDAQLAKGRRSLAA